jgi:hypothetical protein
MIITNGIPGSLSTFESHQSLIEDFNLGVGCRQIDRYPDMDSDFDSDNPAYSDSSSWNGVPDDGNDVA